MEIKEQWRGRCINSTSDLGSIYTFVFSPTPYKPARSNCYYCVRFFARTVNIIEKIESKYIVEKSSIDYFGSVKIIINNQCNDIKCIFLILAGCVSDFDHLPSIEEVCRNLDKKQQLITLFAENYSPINCRSSLEGVFHFDYQVTLFF